jgi:hypothetical protein
MRIYETNDTCCKFWLTVSWPGWDRTDYNQLTASQGRCMINTICCIYNLVPPDDE